MLKKNLWLMARLGVLLVNTLGLSILAGERTNFGLLAGTICGIVALLVLFPWIVSSSSTGDRIGKLVEPFWPMRKYPLAYWITIGCTLSLAAAISLVTSFNGHGNVEFLGGVMIFGSGIISAAVLAHLSMARRREK